MRAVRVCTRTHTHTHARTHAHARMRARLSFREIYSHEINASMRKSIVEVDPFYP